jgi:hypothetical protein
MPDIPPQDRGPHRPWAVAWTAALLAAAPPATAAVPSFERAVAPLLRARCVKCHSGKRPRGDLDLTSRAGLLAGGASGPVVKPGRANDSLLFAHVRNKKMPPKEPLTPAEVTLLGRWIDAGAAWQGPPLQAPRERTKRRAGPDWWSLQPVRRVSPPRGASAGVGTQPG